MTRLLITGGRPLCGAAAAGGAKNAALPMMAAAILADGPVRLENVPRVEDVRTMARVLSGLGVECAWQPAGELLLRADGGRACSADGRLVRRMRASFCVLGPLVTRRGRAEVPLPGGCAIGDRPVDLHLAGLAALGADVRTDGARVVASAKRLRGAAVDMTGPCGPTVTGTANVLSAAVLAKGETTITGAAVEPEIVDLGRLLAKMGARIEGLGTPTLRVRGVDQLGGAAHRVVPDRIETATLLLAAAVTRGDAAVTGAAPEHMDALLRALDAAGFHVEVGGGAVRLRAGARPRPVDVTALPFPGFPSDLQPQWTALMALADGRCTVRDRVFPSRFAHVDQLRRLGADVARRAAAALVTGVGRLVGAEVTASDLRAGAALVLAGLAAEGKTVVRRAGRLDRGYERLDEKLRSLGAEIARRHEPLP